MTLKATWLAVAVIVSAAVLTFNCSDSGTEPTPPGPNPDGDGPGKTGYSKWMPLHKGNKWSYAVVYTSSGSGYSETKEDWEVTDKYDNYHDYEGYAIKQKNWGPPSSVGYTVGGYDGDKCYIFDSQWWEFLIGNTMPWASWSETGLVSYPQLQYNALEDVNVQAGSFKNCRVLNVSFTEGGYTYTYKEDYAENVGLVYAKSGWTSGSYWSYTEYKLNSYYINQP